MERIQSELGSAELVGSELGSELCRNATLCMSASRGSRKVFFFRRSCKSVEQNPLSQTEDQQAGVTNMPIVTRFPPQT